MTTYPGNLTDSQWQYIAKFLDVQRRRKHALREVMNAILYLIKSGCQWRMLPSDFPNWKIVYYYFSVWNKNGLFGLMQEALVEKTRKQSGRKEQPTTGIMDAQSVKASLVSSQERGFDAGKRVMGIKRHIVTDTLGLVLAVVIHSASVQDRDGARLVMEKLKQYWQSIRLLFADGGYRGKLVDWAKQHFTISLQIIRRDKLHTFKILPKRWIIERTFAWIDANRRSAKNYERLTLTSQAVVQLAAIRIMINRF
ncbi:IS5 family transposase [Mucilaginibacter sp.]